MINWSYSHSCINMCRESLRSFLDVSIRKFVTRFNSRRQGLVLLCRFCSITVRHFLLFGLRGFISKNCGWKEESHNWFLSEPPFLLSNKHYTINQLRLLSEQRRHHLESASIPARTLRNPHRSRLQRHLLQSTFFCFSLSNNPKTWQ